MMSISFLKNKADIRKKSPSSKQITINETIEVEYCLFLLLQAFDYENNRCKTLVPELTEKEKQVAKELLENSPLAKEANQYVDINPEEV